MSDINKIDVQSGPGVFRHYENLNLRPWYCLAEYIDNSIGSYQQNKRALQNLDEDYTLTVRIIREADEQRITIIDNAAGIADSELERAFCIGKRPADTSGANEYGVGMKMASFYFTHRWSVRTKALGESVEKTVILDVEDIENSDSTIIDVVRMPMTQNKHFTEVVLESFYPNNWPQGGMTLKKIKTFLGSIFRKYLEREQLRLIFQDGYDEEIILASFPEILDMPFTGDSGSKSRLWKEGVSFNQKKLNKSITGWVGLLNEKQTSHKNAGFELVRRSRVIEGDDNAWFPDKTDCEDYVIFDSGHSEARTRLFGELIFKGFRANNNKSKIDWGPENDHTKDEFLKYLFDLIKEDLSRESESREDRQREFWTQLLTYLKALKRKRNSLENIINKSNLAVSAKMSQDFSSFTKPSDDDLTARVHKQSSFSQENALEAEIQIVIPMGDDKEWLVTFVPYSGSGDGNWFDEPIVVETGIWPRQITIRWDTKHQYSQKTFRAGEDDSVYPVLAPEIFRLIALLVIGEEILKEQLMDNAGRGYFRNFINSNL